MIKFFDLNRQDILIRNKILKDIKNIIKKGDFILGNSVEKFENEFAKFIDVKYAISCANGTDALTIALKALNLPPKSEVIIPAMTYCSTAFAIINAGLKPVLVDIEKNQPTISISNIKNKINKFTKVIMPVHLYGSSVDIAKIKEIIKGKRIKIVDDCAQAHGAIDDSGNNRKIGSTTDISCFSLYPGKNLGAYGDAGIITTNNKKFFNIIKSIRNLGSLKKFIHNRIGMNSRLDTIQAAILLHKLSMLKKNNKKRKKIASIYRNKIKNKNVEQLVYSKNSVYHQYVILVKNRKKLIDLFKKHNIQFGFHYPYPIHKLKALKDMFKNQKYPNAEKLAKKGLSLPIDPNLKKIEINKILKVVNSF